MSQRFPSKIDLWLGTVIIVAAGASIYGGFVLLTTPVPGRWLALAVVLLLGLVLPVWLLVGTHYTIDGQVLVVSCGPFRWRIPLSEIVAIEPTRNPLSSPALSLDRMRIRRRGGEEVMVSPRDKEAFRKELRVRGVAAA